MRCWTRLPIVAALLALAACDGAPTAPGAATRPGAPAFHHATTIVIQAPTQVSSAQAVTATASIAGSWRYVWEYRWCYAGNAAGDCDYVWRPVADGQDITSITKNVYERDKWVDFRVTVLDIYGHQVAYDTHRVLGPYTVNGGDCGSGGLC